ncbi:MAG: ABC transporter permease [Gammaproteobacteria bacterium]|nr:ABC transporter permease [Gammaproteobacteria bacterium]
MLSGAKPVFLLTDIAVFVLIIGVAALIRYSSKKEHLRDSWLRVFRNKMGVSALVILLAYILIGFLDSIHFRLAVENGESQPGQEVHYSNETLSVLDLFLLPLKESSEKTYSAPFATHSYAKENTETEDGKMERRYVRLEHGGAHLEKPEDRWFDIFLRALMGLLVGAFLWAILAAIVLELLSVKSAQSIHETAKKAWHGNTLVPWRVVGGTLLVLCVFAGLLICWGGAYHVLGTDKVGMDVLYQSLKGVRTGLVIGSLATLFMLPLAVLLGISAGYFKGWVDDVIQYLYTTLSSIPGILLIAASVLLLDAYMDRNPDMFDTDVDRANMRLLFLCIILGITSWTGLCRMLRGETLKLSEIDYVQAAVAFGVSHWKIIWRHIQPNVMHIVLIAIVLDFSGLVLAEAVLSYVGVGVDPTMHSWGNMINSARLEMAREPIVWWSLLAAFLFMFTLVLAANLFSDAVRDAFDPRIRKQ